MAYDQRSLDDYVDVAQRIADFRERHPEGRLRPADPARPWEQATVTGYTQDGQEVTQTFIVYVAEAYRDATDPLPGIGVAWEVFPGRTPYTRGSELMNAETSAWGRAIVAVLASDSKRGVASREEVRNRAAEREDGLPVNADGSLSRSRTTDAEKDAAGVMTTAQQAEHTALQPKRGEQTGTVTRLRGPVPDVWQDQPPGLLPQGDPEDTPGSITRDQQKSMHALFTALGVTDRADRLKVTADTLKLPNLASSSDLSYTQAARLLQALAELLRKGTGQ